MAKSQELALADSHFRTRRGGLQVVGKPSYEDWAAFGSVLGQVEGAVHWWIGDWVNYGEVTYGRKPQYGEKYRQALEATGFAYDTLKSNAWVARRIEMCRRRHNVPWAYHQDVAVLEPKEQDQLLDRAEAEGMTRTQLRQAKKALLPTPELPAGKYQVIYADPPWTYGDTREGLKSYSGAVDHYPTMSIQELCDLPVKTIVADDAVLFLWVTSPLLRECFPVITAWGFEYRAQFVWDKVKHNYGHYNSVRHELLLICTRGSCVPETKKLVDSVQVIERSAKHSEKPEEFRKIIETLYPAGPHIELFARNKAKGWATYGNEPLTTGA